MESYTSNVELLQMSVEEQRISRWVARKMSLISMDAALILRMMTGDVFLTPMKNTSRPIFGI